MFCKKCGCVIDDDAVFCYKCGTKVFSDKIPVNPIIEEISKPVNNNTNQETYTQKQEEPSKEIVSSENGLDSFCKRISYDSLATKNFAIMAIFAIIDIFWGLYMFSEAEKALFYSGDEIAWAWFLTICGLITAFLGSIKYLNFKKRFINIYSTYICGIGPGATDFTNEKFEIQYKDIVKIEKGEIMKTITIHAETTKQTIPIEPKELDYVFDLLKNLISKAQTK